jgi:hypothetical protein
MKNLRKLLLFLSLMPLLTVYTNAMKMNNKTEEQKLEGRLLELLYKQDKSLKGKEVKFVHFHYVEYRGFDLKIDLGSTSLLRMLNPTYYYGVEKGESYIRTVSLVFNDKSEILAFGDARNIMVLNEENLPLTITNRLDFALTYPDCGMYHLMGISRGNYFVAFCKDGMKYFRSEKEGYVEITKEEYIDNL